LEFAYGMREYKHYQDFLHEHYFAMQDAARFLVDYLVEDGEYLVTVPTLSVDYLVEDGEYLVTVPTLSPENEYRLPNGETDIAKSV